MLPTRVQDALGVLKRDERVACFKVPGPTDTSGRSAADPVNGPAAIAWVGAPAMAGVRGRAVRDQVRTPVPHCARARWSASTDGPPSLNTENMRRHPGFVSLRW